MKAEIQRKCLPAFSLQATVSKRDKLKEVGPHVEDFFKRIFVIDPKKRIRCSEIIKHPVFEKYQSMFEENIKFYSNYENNEKLRKDDEEEIDDSENQM